ncbi:hypothetical protein P7D52_03310 [Enterococcus dongliensis]|uniref:Tetratricopeptide repeat protein n=1 Tax=Enterococcus dongliensis TaxID=2559925 RepID=A0AAW8TJM3_9ENTE|nr:hypothetical protein [Enterococcus dongliensis]MDT2595849.1 hypothetical protein [Enterococcus dongliensis]MDT2602890.1 hypothetical protein [Enterococcus dongliensis]MDT2633916.1 hypothetical protein [Enterococcus dongliensis]MDT2638233.1 hypothetical protein [Enterococcus dongliensis]MDT2639662.1 hypothetical protein [Enterococcus dongliensis]
MNPIEFPNNDHYYLALAEEAFSSGDYLQALVNYQLAYQKNPSAKLNRLIVSLALEQGKVTEALEYANEASESYLESAETVDLYLQVQTSAKRFFVAREFLWRAKKTKSLTEEQNDRWLMRIDDQELFHQRQQQTMLKQLEVQLRQLPKVSTMEQLLLVRTVKQLPEERLRVLAENFMVDPKVAPLVRSYLFESLARIGTVDKVRYLTIQAEIVELSPTEIDFSEGLQNKIEAGLAERLEDEDPVFLANILEQVKLEMAFLYPLQNSYLKPEAWIASYLSEYLNQAESLDKNVEEIRETIKRLMIDYH